LNDGVVPDMLNRMVEQIAEMDAVFQALSHAARRDMLGRLAGRDHTISELAAPFHMSFAAASKHVKVLERAGLIHRSVRGRQHVCRLVPQPLAQASAWLRFYERFWAGRLDDLEAMFRDTRPGGEPDT
jgi:DNA-binding transcriptional ArsR family regulator